MASISVQPQIVLDGLQAAHPTDTLVKSRFSISLGRSWSMFGESEVRNALRDCYDPEVPCNIVDLGLVYRVEVVCDADAPGAGIAGVPMRHKVKIDMTLTSAGCPAQEQIASQIQGRLAAFQEISRTEVAFVWDPKWTPHRISAEGRKQLSLD